MEKNVEDLADVMEKVAIAQRIAAPYKLEAEVFATALITVKQDPSKSIEEALAMALYEWDL